MCLHERTPKFGQYVKAKEGTHYVQWNDLRDLEAKIDHWLKADQQRRRREIARNAQRHAQAHHCGDARIKYVLTDVIPKLMKAGRVNAV
jgi:hypothetical protein